MVMNNHRDLSTDMYPIYYFEIRLHTTVVYQIVVLSFGSNINVDL